MKWPQICCRALLLFIIDPVDCEEPEKQHVTVQKEQQDDFVDDEGGFTTNDDMKERIYLLVLVCPSQLASPFQEQHFFETGLPLNHAEDRRLQKPSHPI
jgi:hypothetical protein